jgi:DNA-directed RNA polymerase subunit F
MAARIPEKRKLSLEALSKIKSDPKKRKRFLKDNGEKIAELLEELLEDEELPQRLADKIQKVAPGEAVSLSPYLLTVKKESVPLSGITQDHISGMEVVPLGPPVDPQIFTNTKVSTHFLDTLQVIAKRWNLRVFVNLFLLIS